MNSSPTSSSTIPVELPRTEVKPEAPAVAREVPLWRSLFLLLLGGVVWIFFWTKPQASLAPEAGVIMHLPSYVNCGSGFIGSFAPVSAAEHYILPKDTGFERKNYSDYPEHDRIFCGIVLSGATDQSIHRPEVCLLGQGWNIVDQEDIPIKLPSGHLLTVRNLTIKRTEMLGNKPVTLVNYNMYWFVGQQVTTQKHYMRMFLSSWDRIMYNRANRWAYVTVSSSITKDFDPQGLDPAQTKALMVDFIQHIVPTFQKSEMPPGTPSS